MNFFSRIPLLVWFLIPTVFILGLGVWFFTVHPNLNQQVDEKRPQAVSHEVEGTVLYDIVSRTHIAQGTPGTDYNSNPPSSGNHWPSPAAKGIYDNPLSDEQAIHNLEHGYIWIAYKPDIGDDAKNKLKEIVKGDDWKIVMTPRDANETKLALVAWGRVLKMDDVDAEKVKNFIKTYRNRGPEKTPE